MRRTRWAGSRFRSISGALVRMWRRNLLAVAKEEMGHFLTVQNILTVLGGPVLWARGNHPWDNRHFPLTKFELAPLTIESLSGYVYAEAPAKTAAVAKRYYGIDRAEVDRIIGSVRKEVLQGKPHRVEQLYAKIVSIVRDPKLIPDSAFHPETFAIQASWEEWGKGYKPFAARVRHGARSAGQAVLLSGEPGDI
jgi:hypothetical protein